MMFQNYIKVSLRSILRKKLFSVINLAGLALALAACMLIALYVQDEYSFDNFHENGDRIVRVVASVSEKNKGTREFGGSSAMMGPGLQSEIPEIAEFVRVSSVPATVQANGQVFKQEALFVEPNFLSVFTFPLMNGNPENVLANPHSVVLTEETAHRYFGSLDVKGKSLKVRIGDLFEQYVVTGVTKKIPSNSSITFGMLLPLSGNKELVQDHAWLGFSINTFFLLNKEADIKSTGQKVGRVYAEKVKDELNFAKENAKVDLDIRLALQPITELHLNKEYIDDHHGIKNGSTPFYSLILTGIAIFVLTIACINFVNLSIAGSLQRNKEIGIRKVIGGKRVQIIAQFLGESLIICLFAFILAFLLTWMALPAFNEIAGKNLSLFLELDPKLPGIFFLLFLLTGISAGLYPAIFLSGYNPIGNFKKQKLSSKNYFGKTLIILQFAFATFLIVATAVIYVQYDFLSTKSLGYDDTNLLEIDLGDKADTKLIGLFRNDLASDPGVEHITGQFYNTEERVKVGETELDCKSMMADENYLGTLSLKLVAGRNFSKKFSTDVREAVLVNETFMKEAGLSGSEVGQKFGYVWTTEPATIIGVVRDFHHESLREKIKPLIIKMYPGNASYSGKLLVKVKVKNPGNTEANVRAHYKKLLPYYPFAIRNVKEVNEQNYLKEARWRQIITISAAIAMLISCIGLLGLTVMATETRSREIGVRKVLGASVSQIVWLFTTDFVKLVAISIVIALPLGWWAQKIWLLDFAYKAEMPVWLFAGCGFCMIIVAVVPIAFQSLKASLKNPVDVLATD